MIVLWLLYATPFAADNLTDRLENAYPVLKGEVLEELLERIETEEKTPYIIVLGAGTTADPRLDYTHMLSRNVMMRLVEAVRLYQYMPGSVIVTSAGTTGDILAQAEVLRRAALRLGVDPDRLQIQDEPRNTCEEARAFAREREPGTLVIISTAAHHQRRAMMLFRNQGMNPIAAPASFVNTYSASEERNRTKWKPNLRNVNKLEKIIKEYVGYWWGQRC